MPKRLLFDTLRVCLEVGHQVLDLLDLGVGVSVENLREILHKSEIGTHSISQARQLAQLGNEGNLISRAAILVDEQRLIHVVDSLIVAGAVVLLVARRSPVLVESGAGTLGEINSVDLVGLLVVARHDGATFECLLDRFLAVLVSSFGLLPQIVHVGQTIICPDHFEADVDVEKDA